MDIKKVEVAIEPVGSQSETKNPLTVYVAVRHEEERTRGKLAPAAYAFLIPEIDNRVYWGRGGAWTAVEMYAHAIINIVEDNHLDPEEKTLEIVAVGIGFMDYFEDYTWAWWLKGFLQKRIKAKTAKLWKKAAVCWHSVGGTARVPNSSHDWKIIEIAKEEVESQAKTAEAENEYSEQGIAVTGITDATS